MRSAAAVFAAAVLLTACSDDEGTGVRTAAVERGTVEEVVEAPATVVARATATLTAPATGRVAELAVEDGQQVEEGDVILRIASPQARDALARAEEADAEAARAGDVALPPTGLPQEVRDADAAAADAFAGSRAAAARIPEEHARAQALAAVAAAEAQYAAAQAQARDAVARFDAGLGSLTAALGALADAQRVQTRAAVDAAQRTVDALEVRAPVAGTVSLGRGADGGDGGGIDAALEALPPELQQQAGGLAAGSGGSVEALVSEGAPVAAGDTLAVVTDASALSLRAEVDETDVLLVEPGVEGVAELDAVPGSTYAATVAAVDVQPTTSQRGGVSYGVRLTLGAGRTATGEPAPAPRPGMSAVVALAVRTARDVVAVPAAAVFRDGDGEAVWLAEGGVARKRAVRVGAQGADTVEVTEGLETGDRIVVSGADVVREGQELP